MVLLSYMFNVIYKRDCNNHCKNAISYTVYPTPPPTLKQHPLTYNITFERLRVKVKRASANVTIVIISKFYIFVGFRFLTPNRNVSSKYH